MVLALAVTGFMSWRAYVAISGKLSPGVLPVPSKTIDGIIPKSVDASSVGGYDATQFIPRVSHVPESAPAYDVLRVVVNMPVVAGGICSAKKCVCVTQQGTNAGLTESECRAWLADQRFNPYQSYAQASPGQATAYAGAVSGRTSLSDSPAPVPSSVTVDAPSFVSPVGSAVVAVSRK